MTKDLKQTKKSHLLLPSSHYFYLIVAFLNKLLSMCNCENANNDFFCRIPAMAMFLRHATSQSSCHVELADM